MHGRNVNNANDYVIVIEKSPLVALPEGFLTSLDDFYLLSSGLLMTQTSNSVFNTSLFSMLSPHSLLAWQRVRLANSLARTGQQWARIFSKFNSGTIR